MRKFKVFIMGTYHGKPIATVAAESHNAACERVAGARKLNPNDLRAEEIRPFVRVTCGKCGFVFKGRASSFPRCTLCDAEARVNARLRDYHRAVAVYEKIKAKRRQAKETP